MGDSETTQIRITLVAVREDLAAHEVKIRGGNEQPLE
jgi:hypothetical protein